MTAELYCCAICAVCFPESGSAVRHVQRMHIERTFWEARDDQEFARSIQAWITKRPAAHQQGQQNGEAMDE